MSYRGSKGPSTGSGRSAGTKAKPAQNHHQEREEMIDFSKKRMKHYTEDDMFKRVNAEMHIHSNLTSVVTKLKNEGTLDDLYETLKGIIENEVSYTLNVLNFLKSKRKNTNEDFDLKELLFNNIYMFKENFKTTLTILVDDLWNSHLGNPQTLNRLMTTQPKDSSAEQAKPKPSAPGKASNCYPIKEVFDEDEFESPAGTNKAPGSYRASHNANAEEAFQEENLTDRPVKGAEAQLSADDEEENQTTSKRRSAKSVDHSRGNLPRKSVEGAKRPHRPSPAGGEGAKRKVNLDVFSMASGGRSIKKKQVNTLFGMLG